MKKSLIANIIYGICAIVFEVLMVVIGIWFENRDAAEPEGTSIALFGDSVIAYSQDETSVASYLSNYTGLKVTDLSFGGTTMAYTAEDSTLASDRNFLSMVSIALAYASDDFSLPRNHDTFAPATEYFKDRERQVEELDLTNTDIVIIEHCLNDYHCAVPIGNYDDTSVYTYLGALNRTVESIRKINPDIRIILVSPTEKWMPDGVNAADYDYGGGTLDDYVRVQREAASNLGVEYIYLYDLYTSVGYDYEGNEITGAEFTVDGTHPNVYGRELIAKTIAEYLTK